MSECIVCYVTCLSAVKIVILLGIKHYSNKTNALLLPLRQFAKEEIMLWILLPRRRSLNVDQSNTGCENDMVAILTLGLTALQTTVEVYPRT